MDERSISLVEESYRKLLPISEKATETFLALLHARSPAAYLTFTRVVGPDAPRVFALLGAFVENLRDRDALVAALKAYEEGNGVERLMDAHHIAVEVTILWTLRRSLRKEFSTDIELAWIDVITDLSWSAIKSRAALVPCRPVGATLH